MELNPRYDSDPALDVPVEPDAIRVPLVRQRRRLIETATALTDEQLVAPSRCAEWRVVDVLSHLIDVDRFWTVSMGSGAAGTPTRFLEHFDPEASPKQLVSVWADASPADARDAFVEAAEAFCAAADALDDEAFAATAEAPPGHVTVTTMLHHALWDAWIHERDVAVPLGLEVVDAPDEVVAALTYAAGLSPTFGVWQDPSRSGRLVIEATDPDVTLLVDAGHTTSVTRIDGAGGAGDAPVIRGSATTLVEGLSERVPLDHGLDPSRRWMVDGLATVFQPADG